MNLWLDDVREPPEDGRLWLHAKTVEEGTVALIHGVGIASLDHDLGDGELTGYDLCVGMMTGNLWPTEAVWVHSMNIPAHERMVQYLLDHSPVPVYSVQIGGVMQRRV